MVLGPEMSLAGKRIMVPPSRPETNPLLNILKMRGAEVVEFPKLTSTSPSDYGPMDDAVRRLDEFDWIIFSGSDCVNNFFQRLDDLSVDRSILKGRRIGAIGFGAVRALKIHDTGIDYVPKIHTADEVIKGLGDISDQRFLLVRVEGAASTLPQKMKDMGAIITEIDGYRMIIDANEEMIKEVFSSKIDAIALPNPTAIRFLLDGVNHAGLDFKGVLNETAIAVVGPATAETALKEGLIPDIISKGHIADLRDSLLDYFNKN